MNDEDWPRLGMLMSRVNAISGQIDTVWQTLERWDAEQAHDQAILRGMLALITLIMLGLGMAIFWSESQAHRRVEERIQALELRIERLEFVAGGD